MASTFYKLLGVISALSISLVVEASGKQVAWIKPQPVVYVDTCAAIVVTSSALSIDTGLVLLHQAFNSGINLQDNGRVDTAPTGGRWCIQRLIARHGNTLQLDAVRTAFDIECGTQVVPVITGNMVRLDTNLRVRAFDNAAGGIVAIVGDTVIVNATIDVSGCGYRGGVVSINSKDTNVSVLQAEWSEGLSGERGHGPNFSPEARNAGRQASGIGGGGGNARNAGGGGGGGGGRGGNGGFQTSEYGPMPIGGLGGGTDTTLDTGHLYFGGGGGGGHQNDFTGTDGGAGGGIVILVARVLVATDSGRVRCQGEHAQTALNDGAGGGGAGGTIFLQFDSLIVEGNGRCVLDVSGGNGGSSYSALRCYGTGGGGGGGLILCNRTNDLLGLQIIRTGGQAGKTNGATIPCSADSSYGGEHGTAGSVTNPSIQAVRPAVACASPEIRVTILDTVASIGATATIPIQIQTNAPLQQAIALHLRIRARATVLWPENQFWWAGRRYTTRYLNVSLASGKTVDTLIDLRYQCLLGDSVRVIVTADTITAQPPIATIVIVKNGTLTVADACLAGGRVRLFDPFYQMSTTEPASTDVMMVDVLGRIVRRSDLHSSASWYHRR